MLPIAPFVLALIVICTDIEGWVKIILLMIAEAVTYIFWYTSPGSLHIK